MLHDIGCRSEVRVMKGVDEGDKGTVLITGGNRGLGFATALEFAAAGFPVLAAMRSPDSAGDLRREAAERGLTAKIDTCQLDVTDPASIAALDLPKSLAVLVNNAGWEGPRTPAEHLEPALLRQAFEVNVFGPAELTRRVIPIMRANEAGVICQVTSLARLVPQPFLAAYRASKAALATMLESLWGEVSGFGIRVVEVLPGPVATDMLGRTITASAASQPAPYDRLAERFYERRMSHSDGGAPAACGLSVNHRPTPAVEAARRVLRAVLDLQGPLRYGCEPLSERVLDRWREMEDQSFMLDALQVFGVEPQPGPALQPSS